ncbi:hypothetical protein V498_02927 [Pseudogymnoascus sp. VKM F-4517 (FW-2822)]|nr:hypothetical protein V498_02927 [Pseudogymnoascus sp. VKM F-4517 (FW-2822)]
MAGLLKWAKSAVRRAPSPPRQYSNVKIPFINPSEKVEEENFGIERYYPAHIGDVLSSRYQIVGKLGFGNSSTVWLARDLQAHRHVAVKIFTNDGQNTDEIAIYKHISQGNKSRLGYRYVRTALDSFELMNRGDIKSDNILHLIEDNSILAAFEESEIAQPSPRKKAVDREIYISRTLDMPESIGEPVLCDFGNAVYGTKLNDDDAYPDVYRCPEVMLHLPWSYSADIWNVGVMIWDIFEGKHLFSGQDPNRGRYTTRAHLTELISVLGPPPLELIKRGKRSAEWFDGNGKWLEPDENEPERLPLLPSSSFEAAEENLNGKDKELFLNFIKSMLQWEPEKRMTARELLNDPWLTRSQVTKPYVLRDGAAKALNESPDVSDSVQNLVLQHASIDTFLKHYLGRNINVDVQNIHRGLEPQKALMRFACSMSRSIDPRRPWKLTPAQSASFNNLPCIVQLSKIAAHLSGSPEGSRREVRYQKVQKRLTSEKARQRRLLLLEIVDRYKKEQPVIDSERQLSGKMVDEDVRGALERSDHMTPEQLLLVDAVLTLPETSLERESQRRIAAINAVAAYCGVEEGVTFRRSRAGRPVPPISAVKDEKPLRSEADIMLRHAISSVTTDKRPTICFACLGNPNLTIRERVVSFSSPGCLTRHFMRKHVRRLGVDEPTECRICDVRLEHRMDFQNHAEKFHGGFGEGTQCIFDIGLARVGAVRTTFTEQRMKKSQ